MQKGSSNYFRVSDAEGRNRTIEETQLDDETCSFANRFVIDTSRHVLEGSRNDVRSVAGIEGMQIEEAQLQERHIDDSQLNCSGEDRASSIENKERFKSIPSDQHRPSDISDRVDEGIDENQFRHEMHHQSQEQTVEAHTLVDQIAVLNRLSLNIGGDIDFVKQHAGPDMGEEGVLKLVSINVTSLYKHQASIAMMPYHVVVMQETQVLPGQEDKLRKLFAEFGWRLHISKGQARGRGLAFLYKKPVDVEEWVHTSDAYVVLFEQGRLAMYTLTIGRTSILLANVYGYTGGAHHPNNSDMTDDILAVGRH